MEVPEVVIVDSSIATLTARWDEINVPVSFWNIEIKPEEIPDPLSQVNSSCIFSKST